MSLYSASVTTPAAAAAAAFAAIRAASTDRVRVKEIGGFLNAATATSAQLVRAATNGTASTTTAMQPNDPSDPAATSLIVTAWSVAPTISTNVPLRRVVMPATAGNGWVWVFPDPIIIASTADLLLWNFGAGAASALSLYVVVDE